MYWNSLCLMIINESKGFKMNVTSTTQTQYVSRNSNTKESTSTEYKKSTDVVAQKRDEHK